MKKLILIFLAAVVTSAVSQVPTSPEIMQDATDATNKAADASLKATDAKKEEIATDKAVVKALQNARIPFTIEQTALVTTLAYILTQMAKAQGVPKKYALYIVMVLAAIGLFIYLLDYPDKKYSWFGLALAWGQIVATCAGIFGITVRAEQQNGGRGSGGNEQATA